MNTFDTLTILRNFRNFRRYFQLENNEEIKLTTIFNSSVPALKNYLCELVDLHTKSKSSKEFHLSSKTNNDFLKNLGYQKLLDDCDNNLDLAKAQLNARSEGRPSKEIKTLREVYKNKIASEFDWNFSSIDEVINQL